MAKKQGRDLVSVSHIASGCLKGALPAHGSFISILIGTGDLFSGIAQRAIVRAVTGYFLRLDVDEE